MKEKADFMAYLAADIGGTKTHLNIYQIENEKLIVVKDQKYKSHEHPNLESIVQDFLKDFNGHIERACFGIAGPIHDQVCKATNLPWVVDGKKMQKELKIDKVFLINDLEANAYGIKKLNPEDFFVLNKGEASSKGNLALISAGTGLGEAGFYFDGKETHPFPSEGGHADFAPRDAVEIELLKYLQGKYGHVSYERILSGPGFFDLYLFYTECLKFPKCAKVESREVKSDPSRIISEAAIEGKDKTCEEVMHRFVSIYGAESGNLALKFLALGGVYIGGGIAPKILEKMKNGPFLSSFINKGRFEGVLKNIPIKVILDENTALKGAALYCFTH